MPLPAANTPWPPKPLAPILDQMNVWDAWYVGSPDRLEDVYATGRATHKVRPSQHAGGIAGAVSRWWWGRPKTDPSSSPSKLHIPAAADIAVASADLLFSEEPQIEAADPQRIEAYLEQGLVTTLAEGAEIAAALGGVYLRATWDQEISPAASFVSLVHADAALPVFRWGRLVAVTFWHVVGRDASTVTRHVETHETDGTGTGVIFHGLYVGTASSLGRQVPLADHPSTAGIPVDAESKVSTLSPGLDVVYVPNQTPNRTWRKDPVGVNLGRSDFDGVEPLMDALDEAWSSWMRDLRLGKARLIAAQNLLQSKGPGSGATFDIDREIWSPVRDGITDPTKGNQLAIEQVQFEIRVDEHQRTTSEILEQIRRTAGYSAQTFGELGDGTQQTATEVTARERRSYLTRDRKVRQWQPALRTLITKMVAIDAAVLHQGKTGDAQVKVTFADGVQESPEALARTATMLEQARAASTKVKVALVHPDWDTTQVDEEVALIQSEQGTSTDPFAFTGQ